jgi:hypothetical protein
MWRRTDWMWQFEWFSLRYHESRLTAVRMGRAKIVPIRPYRNMRKFVTLMRRPWAH